MATEHKCVLDSCRQLQLEDFEVTYLPVQAGTGLVDLKELKEAIRPETVLISVSPLNRLAFSMQFLNCNVIFFFFFFNARFVYR